VRQALGSSERRTCSVIGQHRSTQRKRPQDDGDDGRRPGTRKGVARERADRAVDAIRARFGWNAVRYASGAAGGSSAVPDAFRALAEKEL